MKSIFVWLAAVAACPSFAASYVVTYGIDASAKHRSLFKVDLQTLAVSKIESSPGLDLGEHAVLRSGEGHVFALSQEQKRVHILDANRNFIWERSVQGDAQPADLVTDGSSAYIAYPNSRRIERIDLASGSLTKRYDLPPIPGPRWQFRPQFITIRDGKLYATADTALDYPYNPIARINLDTGFTDMAFADRFFDSRILTRGESLIVPYYFSVHPWLLGEAPIAWTTSPVQVPGTGKIQVIDGQIPIVQTYAGEMDSVISMDCLGACNDVYALVRRDPGQSGASKLTLERLDLVSGERHEYYAVTGVRFGLNEGKYFPTAEYQEYFEELDTVGIDPQTRRVAVLERSEKGSGIHVFEEDGTDLGLVSLGDDFEPFSMTLVNAEPSDETLEGDLVLTMWPNPAAEGQTVTVNMVTTSPRSCQLRAFNPLGQEMALGLGKIELDQREKTLSFNPAALRWAAGTYALSLDCGNRRVAKKVVYVNL